jgi:hypothetical protein
METARAMLYQSQLSLGLWSYAVKYANFLLNRTLIVSNIINGNKILKTPYEWVFQNKPDLTHIRTWGCEAYALIDQQHRRTLDQNSTKSYFIGYAQDSTQTSIILYNKDVTYNKGIFVSGHVIFNEIINPRIHINNGNVVQVNHNMLNIENIINNNEILDNNNINHDLDNDNELNNDNNILEDNNNYNNNDNNNNEIELNNNIDNSITENNNSITKATDRKDVEL